MLIKTENKYTLENRLHISQIKIYKLIMKTVGQGGIYLTNYNERFEQQQKN